MKPIVLSLCLMPAACMAPANAPSLAPRPIEMRANAVEPIAPEATVRPLDGSLAARIAALLGEATKADAAFSEADVAGQAVLKGGRKARQGSEAWIAAQQAQSLLEVAHQRTAAALGEIDVLVIAQAKATADDPSAGGLSELQSAQAVIDAMSSRQAARIEELTR